MGQKKYIHVPNWLASRFECIAALEDNPVYLKEAGKRYQRKRRLLPTEYRSGVLQTILVFFILIITMGLALPLLFLALIALPNSIQTMHKHLEQEWQSGWLQQIELTHLKPHEIVWGYFGITVLDQIRFVPMIFVIIAGLEVFLPGIINLFFSGAIFSEDFPVPYHISIPIAIVLLLVAGPLTLLSVFAVFVAILTELENIAQSVAQQTVNLFVRLFIVMMITIPMFLPGILCAYAVNTILFMENSILLGIRSLLGNWDTGIILILDCAVFAALSCMISYKLVKIELEHFQQRSEKLYREAIRRLGRGELLQASSRIFGEK